MRSQWSTDKGCIETLLIHKDPLLPKRPRPLMIPYLHNKTTLFHSLWNAQGCISSLTIWGSGGVSFKLLFDIDMLWWGLFSLQVLVGHDSIHVHKQHCLPIALILDYQRGVYEKQAFFACPFLNPHFSSADRNRGPYHPNKGVIAWPFPTLKWKSKTQTMDCVISAQTHKGMAPIKVIHLT